MSDGVISKIQLPDENTYDIIDSTSGYITGMTILSYGSSTWDNFIEAYNSNKVVYCRASSNSNPATGSQTRLAFMAYVNNAATPTEVEFQYYRSVSTHTESQQGDQVYVYKLNKTNGWSVTTREASVKVVAGTGLGGTYSNGTMTLTGPTKVSDLTNDSGFVTTDEKLKTTATSIGYTKMYPIITSSSSTADTKNYCETLAFYLSSGYAKIQLGESGGDGVEPIPGSIRLFNAAGGSISLLYDEDSAYNRDIYLPNKAGNKVMIATLDDIPTSTSTPTANEVAEFDSSAHMNSTDMSSQDVDDFVDGLNVSPTGLIDIFYPVGSYYETSDTSFDPNVAWGGTWQRETEGLVHIGSGSTYTAGNTGGEKTHTLKAAEAAQKNLGAIASGAMSANSSHSHGTGEAGEKYLISTANVYVSDNKYSYPATSSNGVRFLVTTSTGTQYVNEIANTASASLAHTHSTTISGSDASSAHNNMQPYVVVNRWHRIA